MVHWTTAAQDVMPTVRKEHVTYQGTGTHRGHRGSAALKILAFA